MYDIERSFLFDCKESKKTLNYVIANDTLNRRCNRCKSVVLKETKHFTFPYQCMFCDDNLFESNTHMGEPHSDAEFEKLCCNTRDLLLLDD